jgi:hypothetical protein
MSEGIVTVEINSIDEFNAACAVYGVTRGAAGRLPKKALAGAIIGKGHFITPTTFLQQSDALTATGTLSAPVEMTFTLTFRTEGADGKLSKVKTVTLTSSEVRKLTAGMNGAIGPKRLIAALAATLNVTAESIFAVGEAGKLDYTSAPVVVVVEAPKEDQPEKKEDVIADIQELLQPVSA